MRNDTIIEFENPHEPTEDGLTTVLRDVATRLTAQIRGERAVGPH